MWDFVMDKSVSGAGFLSENFGFPANLHSICFSTIIFTITRGWHNRPRVAAVPIALQIKNKIIKKQPLCREGGFASYEYVWPSVKCTFRTYSMSLKILPFALHTSPLFSTGFTEQIKHISRILCYNGNLVT
jgi:hypothetical protein